MDEGQQPQKRRAPSVGSGSQEKLSDGTYASAEANLGDVYSDTIRLDVTVSRDMRITAVIALEEARKLASQINNAISFFDNIAMSEALCDAEEEGMRLTFQDRKDNDNG